jgi:type VI secretion system protein ImpL
VTAVFVALVAVGLVLGLVAALSIWRARRAPKKPAVAGGSGIDTPSAGWLTTVFEALDYARTRRAWRYRLPWILVLGERGAGKSSLALSAGRLDQPHPDERYVSLHVPGGEWSVMNRGALIDIDGEVWDAGASLAVAAAAASPSAAASPIPSGVGEAKESKSSWDKLLSALVDLRPERPVDGIVLTVSARTLIRADAAERERIATDAYCRLCDMQDAFRFVLPVAVVVTQCDLVDGFAAFWRAQPEALRQQMFGWSAPVLASNDTPPEWCDAAFNALDEQLRVLQLDSAARDEQGTNEPERDGRLLFPARLKELHGPLAQWLATVFCATLDRPGHLCRGIYFTGDLNGGGLGPSSQVAFVTGLIEDKVFAERGNARVVRASAWSRNRYLRAFQITALNVAAVLAIGLAASGVRLHSTVQELDRTFAQLQTEPAYAGGVCPSAGKVSSLLMAVRELDTHSFYWANPWSWFGRPLRTGAGQVVAGHVFVDVILPGLSCRLTVRAQNLLARGQAALLQTNDPGVRLREARAALYEQLHALIELEASLGTFKAVARPYSGAATDQDLRRFAELVNFAYGLPVGLVYDADRSGVLATALSWASTDARPNLPDNLAEIYAVQLKGMETRLRDALVEEAGAGQQLLVDLAAGRGDPAAQTRQLVSWLDWTRDNWLGQTSAGARHNLCGQIRSDLNPQIRRLVLADASSGEEAVRGGAAAASPYSGLLDETAAIFSAEGCDAPVYAKLDGLTVAPYDPLIVRAQEERIFNPAFSAEFTGLTALAQLPFMQATQRRETFACDASAQAWNADSLGDAAAYIAQYRGFAQRFSLKPAGALVSRPLYARIAAKQLENALNHALNDAERPKAPGANVWPAGTVSTALAPAPFDEQSLAQTSGELARSVGTLISIERSYQEFGFSAGYAALSGCLQQFAANRLATINSLAVQSELYRPQTNGTGPEFFDLGTVAVTRDYLGRQVARAQVLATYAAPFVTLAQNSGNAANAGPNTQTAAYWGNSIAEVNRYVPSNDPASEMGQLAALFVDRLSGMTAQNCGARLTNLAPTAGDKAGGNGDNLFASLRGSLVAYTEMRCQGADVDAFMQLFALFDATLAGRYPFGQTAPEASPVAVREFFAAYAQQRATLRAQLKSLPKPQQPAVRSFLDHLDDDQKFFAATMRSDGTLAIHLSPTFNVRQSAERGADQVLGWTLSAAGQSASYPPGETVLDWVTGQPISLALTWADLSRFTPYADGARSDAPAVDGRTATFMRSGNWALLRFIQGYASAQGASPADGVTLRFAVPTATFATTATTAGAAPAAGSAGSAASGASAPAPASLGMAQLMMNLRLTGVDATSHAPVALKLPVFPASAPVLQTAQPASHASPGAMDIPTVPPLPPLPPGAGTQAAQTSGVN